MTTPNVAFLIKIKKKHEGSLLLQEKTLSTIRRNF